MATGGDVELEDLIKARDDYYKKLFKYLDYVKATDTTEAMNEYYVVFSEHYKTNELAFIIWGYHQRSV